MLSRWCYLLLLLVPLQVWADLTVFDVRKNLPMSDSDPVFRDFIINGGTEAGLSVGMVVSITRRIPLYDSYQNRSAGDLQVKVARVKIIHAQHGLAVARLHAEFSRESTPLLEDNYIMVGDHVDLASAGSDKKAESSSESAPPSAAQAPPQPAKAIAQISVNSVDLPATHEAKAQLPSATPPASQKVDQPSLQ
jgi:hypothetical protein